MTPVDEEEKFIDRLQTYSSVDSLMIRTLSLRKIRALFPPAHECPRRDWRFSLPAGASRALMQRRSAASPSVQVQLLAASARSNLTAVNRKNVAEPVTPDRAPHLRLPPCALVTPSSVPKTAIRQPNMSDGNIFKPEKDFTNEADKVIPEAQEIAKVSTTPPLMLLLD